MRDRDADQALGRALVVDDDATIRLLLDATLSEAGWVVEAVSSGSDALVRWRDDAFDVIVLDSEMPGLTGLQVVRRLRNAGCKTPIVLFSAHLTPDVTRECARLGIPAVDKLELRELVGKCGAFLDGRTRTRGWRLVRRAPNLLWRRRRVAA